MKQRIRLTENDLNRIVEEAVNGYINEASFGGWKMFGKDNKQQIIEQNRGILLSVINRLAHNLHNEMTYLKYNGYFQDLNPMFIQQMPEGKEKDQKIIAQKIIAECVEFYNLIMELKGNI